MRKSHANNRRAFTVIELMVVIGVLVLLMAILLPALAAAPRSGKRVAISSQLQTITTALTAYEQDFKALPPCTEITAAGVNVQKGFGVLGVALVGAGGKYNSARK